MPDVHGADLFGELDRNDPLRVELVRLRSLAECAPPAPSRDLAAFLADPHAARAAAPYHLGSLEQKRSTIMKVIHIRLGKARRAALAAGAAMGLAAVGASAVAAIGETGGPWHTHTVVSDATTTTSTESPTTTSTEAPTGTETTTSTETDTSTSTTSTTATESPTTDEPGGGATHAPNARAFANHHDGVGADDTHADVRGGGSVDHHSGSKPGDDGSGDDAGGSQRGGQSNH